MELKASLFSLGSFRTLLTKGIGTPLLIIASLGMVVLPMPALMLDILFTFNIALSLLVLLVSVYTRRPLDFAAFPTVLLVATVAFRRLTSKSTSKSTRT